MKNLIFFHFKKVICTCLILLPLTLFSQNYKQSDSYLNHLKEINAEWQHHVVHCPEGQINFESDDDRIQLHLELVCESLKNNIPAHLTSAQLDKRNALIKALEVYAQTKIFPINTNHLVRQPYFVDNYGIHCAVGQLMYVSGNEDLVTQIKLDHNYDYIQDIKTPGVSDWATEHGFTMAELKWIQPGYPPNAVLEALSNGTNGSVTRMVNSLSTGAIMFTGSFSEVDNLPCANIGYYQNSQLSCYGNGINGTINDMIELAGNLTVFGEFEDNGILYPAANFDGSSWTYIDIPSREGAVASAGYYYNSTLYEVVIHHPTLSNISEIWQNNGGVWTRKAKVDGIILELANTSQGVVYGGHFSTVTAYEEGSSDSTIYQVNNVIIDPLFSTTWHDVGTAVSDTVKAIIEIGTSLYLGGTCSNNVNQSDVCLSKYLNNSSQAILLRSHFLESGDEGVSINSIAFDNHTKLYLGGEFAMAAFVGIYGNNLAAYHLVYNGLEPLAQLNGSVESLTISNNDLYFGGNFTTNLFNQNLNHLGIVASTANIISSNQSAIAVFPNPFSGIIHVEGVKSDSKYVLINSVGQTVSTGLVTNQTITGLNDLPKGSYILQIDSKEGRFTRQVVK